MYIYCCLYIIYRVVFTGGTGGRVLVTGFWNPSHWSWFERPWVGRIWCVVQQHSFSIVMNLALHS